MRILQVVMRRQRRGAEVFAGNLSDALVRRGHEVELLALYSPPDDDLKPELATWRDLPAQSSRGVSPMLLRSLATAIDEFAPDVLQANGADTLKYSALLRYRRRSSWPLVYRNISIASTWLRFPGQRAWLRWLLRKVDRVAAVSDASMADFRNTYELDAAKMLMIPNGVSIPGTVDREAARAKLRNAACIPDGAEVLLHVGSFSPEKNHVWMLRSLTPVLEARENVHLVLIGDGPTRPAVESLIDVLGHRARVRCLGTRADAADLTAGADLLLLPSLIEGIPGVILEASAHGTPTVAADVGSISDAVDDGETGSLVASGDTVGFSKAILDLLADPGRRRAMGVRARERVADRYGMDGVVNAFENLYLELSDQYAPAN
jgi:L-malate glycosyltransferase